MSGSFCVESKRIISQRNSLVSILLNKNRKGLMVSSAMSLNSSITLSVFCVISVLLTLLTPEGQVSAFPDGAPGSACVRHKPNHGGTAQPLALMPFSVTASSSTYSPGETIAGLDYF